MLIPLHSFALLSSRAPAALAKLAVVIGVVSNAIAGGLPTGSPSAIGMDGATLNSAVALYKRAVEADEHRGVVVLVARRGKVVLHEAVGYRDFDHKTPLRNDALFRMASNTKPVIATAILMLAEEGKLTLADNVRKHLPSFDNYRAGWIQIQHLLSHTSGLRMGPIFLEPLLPGTTLQKEVARFGEIGADFPPGTSYSYNNPGFNTLGALIEVVSGESLEGFLAKRIYKPLGMRDSSNHESKADHDRMSTVYSRDDTGTWKVEWKPGDKPDYPFVRASGGMISSTSDYARFCEMWRRGGELDGTRLLTKESVKAAWTPAPNTRWGKHIGALHYGYGWVYEEGRGWSHGGSDGTFALVNPDEELIVLLFGQSRGPGLNRLGARFIEMVHASIVD